MKKTPTLSKWRRSGLEAAGFTPTGFRIGILATTSAGFFNGGGSVGSAQNLPILITGKTVSILSEKTPRPPSGNQQANNTLVKNGSARRQMFISGGGESTAVGGNTTITINQGAPRAQVGDTVWVGRTTTIPDKMSVDGYVSAPNVITLSVRNDDAGAQNIVPANLRYEVSGPW